MDSDPVIWVLRILTGVAPHGEASRVGPLPDAVPAETSAHEVTSHGSRDGTRYAQRDCDHGQNITRRTVSAPAREAAFRPIPFSTTPGPSVRVVLPLSLPAACRAHATADPPPGRGGASGGDVAYASQERPTTPPSHGAPVAIEAIQEVLQDEHEDQYTFPDDQWSAVNHVSPPLLLLGVDLDDARARNDASISASRHDNMVGQQRVADARQAAVWREHRHATARPSRPMHTASGAQRQAALRHASTDQIAKAPDTEDGGGDSSDESFDYDSSGGGFTSDQEEGVVEEAPLYTEMHRPYTNAFRGRSNVHDSETLRAYSHTRRPFEGPDTLVVQIEERRAELAFLRVSWSCGVAHPNDQEVALSPPALPPSPLQ